MASIGELGVYLQKDDLYSSEAVTFTPLTPIHLGTIGIWADCSAEGATPETFEPIVSLAGMMVDVATVWREPAKLASLLASPIVHWRNPAKLASLSVSAITRTYISTISPDTLETDTTTTRGYVDLTKVLVEEAITYVAYLWDGTNWDIARANRTIYILLNNEWQSVEVLTSG